MYSTPPGGLMFEEMRRWKTANWIFQALNMGSPHELMIDYDCGLCDLPGAQQIALPCLPGFYGHLDDGTMTLMQGHPGS